MVRAIGGFDAAVSNDQNAAYYQYANGHHADVAMSPEARRRLRNRSRYEVANNTYARGIVDTICNDLVGTGPRLQLPRNLDGADELEAAWLRWSDEIDLAGKLRAARRAKAVDGEFFAVRISNPAVAFPVQLDLQLIEAERIASPDFDGTNDPLEVDGIRFDRFGNPETYFMHRRHPGDDRAPIPLDEFDQLGPDQILHWFGSLRAEQSRGIPDITAALPLFGQLRRYTLAVIASAEMAASVAGVFYSDAPVIDDEDLPEGGDIIDLERNQFVTLPAGWKMSQLKAEQPVTGYAEFKHEILSEVARVLSVPRNVAMGDSSEYNYASGRLDHQTYFKSLTVERDDMARRVLNPVLREFAGEAALAGLISTNVARAIQSGAVRPAWMFDAHEHVDPTKEAKAIETGLLTNTTTLADEWAKKGHDWQAKIAQRAEEVKQLRELGIEIDPAELVENEESNSDEAA